MPRQSLGLGLVGCVVSSRIRLAAHTAFTTIRWATVRHATYTLATEEVLLGLEAAYALGYRACRADAAQAVGQLVGEHETFLDES